MDVAGLRFIASGFVDGAAVVAKGTDGLDPPLGIGSFRLNTTNGPSSSVGSDAGVVCVSVPFTDSAEDVSVPTEDNVKARKPLSPTRTSVR